MSFPRPSPDGDDQHPCQDHSPAEDLAHGKGAEDESQLRVGLAGKFDEEADRPIPDQVEGHKVPLKGPDSPQSPENQKQKDALEEGLVELRRMAQLPGGVFREVHAPGKSGHPSIKLPVDEVSDPSESITQGDGGAEEIG